jgi:hypothetical protein
MTGNEVYERFVRLASAGIQTDESRWDEPYVQNLVDTCRATAIQSIYVKTKIIHPNWVQELNLEFSEDLQEDNCFQRFECPMFLSLDGSTQGLMFVGSQRNNCTIPVVRTRAELGIYQNNRVTANRMMGLYVYPYLDIYQKGIMLEQVRVSGVFQYPFQLPTYNKMIDEYPVTTDVLEIMEEIWVSKLKVIMATPLDVLPDSKETPATLPKQ